MPRPLQPGRKRQPDAIGASYPVASANRMRLTSATQSQSPTECDWGQLRSRKHQSNVVGGCDSVAGGSGFFMKKPDRFRKPVGFGDVLCNVLFHHHLVCCYPVGRHHAHHIQPAAGQCKGGVATHARCAGNDVTLQIGNRNLCRCGEIEV